MILLKANQNHLFFVKQEKIQQKSHRKEYKQLFNGFFFGKKNLNHDCMRTEKIKEILLKEVFS